jgi:uncharacterized membrane protein
LRPVASAATLGPRHRRWGGARSCEAIVTDSDQAIPRDGRTPPRSLRHPGILLAILDAVGLLIAGYLAAVALRGEVPTCGIARGCEEVALSEYSRVAGIPVAVLGVVLSVTLLVLALAWWRTGSGALLLLHYALSLTGVLFEAWFTWLELFVIGAVCVWCAAYAVSLVARFLLSLAVWLRRDRYRPAT